MRKMFYNNQVIDKEKLVDMIVEDQQLRDFFITNDLDTNFIEKNLSLLFNFKVENDRCENCEGLKKCKQDTVGYQPVIKYIDESVQVFYQECPFYLRRKELNQQEGLIDSLYMPKMIYNARLDDYDFGRGQNRTIIFNKINNFITKYMNGDTVKGLYLHGEYQKGKTYSLAATANELSKKGVKVVIAYYPDLVRELKSRISNNTLEEMVSKLKTAEILMLDDIGGESQSAWVRDEILGPILQHRLLDEKPTFFSSNVTQKELLTIMTSNSQKAEVMKAARINARIRTLADEYKM